LVEVSLYTPLFDDLDEAQRRRRGLNATGTDLNQTDAGQSETEFASTPKGIGVISVTHATIALEK
jgi:hypothetical protein